MQYSQVKEKSKEELQRVLEETREALRKAHFSVSQKQLKNVRSIREYRKTIARVLTHASHT